MRAVEVRGRGTTTLTVDIGARRERREVGEGLGDVVVCPVDILVFLGTSVSVPVEHYNITYARQDAVEPVQHVLLDRHRGALSDAVRVSFVVCVLLSECTCRSCSGLLVCCRVSFGFEVESCIEFEALSFDVVDRVAGYLGYLRWGSGIRDQGAWLSSLWRCSVALYYLTPHE